MYLSFGTFKLSPCETSRTLLEILDLKVYEVAEHVGLNFGGNEDSARLLSHKHKHTQLHFNAAVF